MEENKKSKQSPLVPILVIGLIVFAFVSGSLWQKVKSLEKGNSGTVAGTQQAPQANYLSIENLKIYAQDLKLDTKKFNSCLDNSERKSDVEKELNEGIDEGVSGTPGFFLNGHFISGALPFEMFKTFIDYELATGFDSGKKPTEEVQKLIDQGIIDTSKKEVKIENYPSRGPQNAKITLVEYSDFECPYCVRANPTVKKILETYPNNIRLVYKQFPLINIHPNAMKAAEASLCAKDQGKFWEYHDKLFDSATSS